jgi:chromosome segregation ATPase
MSLRTADAEEAARPLPQEVQSENAPVPVERLFQDYVGAREDARRLGEERAANLQRLTDLTQQVHQVQGQYTTEVRPVRSELSQARAKLAVCNRVLTAREPPKPVLTKVPSPPHDTNDQQGWQNRRDRIEAENRAIEERYKRNLETFHRYQDQARKEKSGLEQRINQLEAQLAALDARQTSEQTPLLAELRALREAQSNLAQQIGAAMSRARSLADALRQAPEDQRLRRGICEWEDTFYSVDELRRILDDLKAACDRDRAELKAKAEADSRTLPEDWRHPKQDTLDALHSLIERATSASK